MGNCPTTILKTGNTYQLIANVAPADAEDKSVTWSSSNAEVASVDENGLVSALSQGSVKITATTNDGGYSGNCNIGVMGNATGVEKFYNNESVKIYPNPSSGKLYVELSDSELEKTIKIYNTEGQLLMTKKTYLKNEILDIGQFNGESLLLVTIITEHYKSSFKVILSKI